jgi:hypothetical protein
MPQSFPLLQSKRRKPSKSALFSKGNEDKLESSSLLPHKNE